MKNPMGERHVKINDNASVATYDFNGNHTVMEQPVSQIDNESEINERLDSYSELDPAHKQF